jgi:hypothetical protein
VEQYLIPFPVLVSYKVARGPLAKNEAGDQHMTVSAAQYAAVTGERVDEIPFHSQAVYQNLAVVVQAEIGDTVRILGIRRAES